jgi:hypothetical protein
MKNTKPKKSQSYESAPTIKTPGTAITHEEIRLRAYEIFLTRGGTHGNDHDDWLLAEHELKQGRSRKP